MSFVKKHASKISYKNAGGEQRGKTNDLNDYVKKKQQARERAAAIRKERETKAVDYSEAEQKRIAESREARQRERRMLSPRPEEESRRETPAPSANPDDDRPLRSRAQHPPVADRRNTHTEAPEDPLERAHARRRDRSSDRRPPGYGEGRREHSRGRRGSEDDYDRGREDSGNRGRGRGGRSRHAEDEEARYQARRHPGGGRRGDQEKAREQRDQEGASTPRGPLKSDLLERVYALETEIKTLTAASRRKMEDQEKLEMMIRDLEEEDQFPSFQF